MSIPKKDKATGERITGYSNISKDITDFISNKDKVLINLVKVFDHSIELIDIFVILKSDFKKLKPFL